MTKRQKYIVFGALLLSLAINVVILGGAGYAAFKFRSLGKEGWVESRIERGERFFLKNLEADDRVIAQKIFDDRRPALKSALHDMRQARRDLGLVLREDTTSPENILAILDRSQDAAGRTNMAFHGLLRDMTSQMSPAAREKIGAHLRRHHRSGSQHMRDFGSQHMRDPGSQHMRDPGSQYMRDPGSQHMRDPGSQHMRDDD